MATRHGYPHMGEDVNERAREGWKEDTTPRERVRSIIRRTYEPQSAAAITDRALVPEGLARFHLDLLAENGFVEVEGGDVEPRYRRVPDSVISERAEQILDVVDVETLERRVGELRETVREYEAQAGMESPHDASVGDADLGAEDITEWVTARRNLKFAEAVLLLSDEGP